MRAITIPLTIAVIWFAFGCSSIVKTQHEVPSSQNTRSLSISNDAIEIFSDNKRLIKLYFNGKTEISDDYNVTKAALEFWNSIAALIANSERELTTTMARLYETQAIIEGFNKVNMDALDKALGDRALVEKLLGRSLTDTTKVVNVVVKETIAKDDSTFIEKGKQGLEKMKEIEE